MDNRYVQVALRAAMSIALFGLLVALAAKVSVVLTVVVAVLGVAFMVAGVMMDRTNTMLERADFKELSRLAQALPTDEVVPAPGVWQRVKQRRTAGCASCRRHAHRCRIGCGAGGWSAGLGQR
ncbi:hypothetical protein ACIBI9_55920 [Nonomuraea sp. NPDC050451]|uniref:hypothetical protein n=1 Tax=Nonomuraea sp. NPDC050451 TaxID=3364364 RepID=UPI00378F9153